jgi:branched-chain amino acid aminotransferase
MPTVAAQHAGVHVAIAVWPWPSYFDPAEKLKGIRLDISEWRRPAPDTAPTRAKAAGLYMICTLSKHTAESKGYSDALMFDYRGLVAEATGANVFFVRDGQLHTATPDCFLDGITRRSVMALASALKIPVRERSISNDDWQFTKSITTLQPDGTTQATAKQSWRTTLPSNPFP